MDIHARIKARRTELGLSLKDLADLCGVVYQTVQAWERPNGTAPRRHLLKTVADVLKTSVEWLNGGIDASLELDNKYAFIPRYGARPDTKDGDVEHHDEIENYKEASDTYAWRKEDLAAAGVQARTCRVVLSRDTSMNLGSQLLVDLSDRHIRSGKIYALATPFGEVARRILVREDGALLLRADDPDVADKLMHPDELPLIGRVVAHQGLLL